MENSRHWNHLSLISLKILLEHLRLGPAHLKNLLTKKQYTDLLDKAILLPEQKADLITNKTELRGNVSMVLNTMVTSMFGAWMGLSGCFGVRLNSPQILSIVTSATFALGSLIAYSRFHMIKQEAMQAIEGQKISNLELQLLKTIKEKLQMQIAAEIQEIYSNLEEIPINFETNRLETEEEIKEWLSSFNNYLNQKKQMLKNSSGSVFFEEQVTIHFDMIRKLLKQEVEVLDLLSSPPKGEQEVKTVKEEHQKDSFLTVLTNPELSIPKTFARLPSWIKGHMRSVAASLTPVVVGGFSSMFVFVKGIPDLAQEFHLEKMFQFLTQPKARGVEVLLAALITCYFGFSHLYTSRKSARRIGNIEKTRTKITSEETNILEEETRLGILRQVKSYVLSLKTIWQALNRTQLSDEADIITLEETPT